MSVISIVQLPATVLRTVAAETTAATEADLIANLTDTAEKLGAWGLAAPQLGVARRVAVVARIVGGGPAAPSKPDWKQPPIVLVNPVLISYAGGDVRGEACLSLPGRVVQLWRPRKIQLGYQDATGEYREAIFSGWQGRAVQHELDHLNGILIIDQSSKLDRLKVGA